MAEDANRTNFVRYMSNPRAFTLKKWFIELLKEKYTPHDNIVERVSAALTTDKDVEDFGKLIMQVYESAYLRAVSDYKQQAEQMGLRVNVIDKPN